MIAFVTLHLVIVISIWNILFCDDCGVMDAIANTDAVVVVVCIVAEWYLIVL